MGVFQSLQKSWRQQTVKHISDPTLDGAYPDSSEDHEYVNESRFNVCSKLISQQHEFLSLGISGIMSFFCWDVILFRNCW